MGAVSSCRQETLIEAPIERVWALVGDPRRHPEWFPRVVDVTCDEVEQGCTFREVARGPFSTFETEMLIERLEDCREVAVRCTQQGTHCRFALAPARDGTFVKAEFGLDPESLSDRVWDRTVGRRYFRRWLQDSLAALERAASSPRPG
jgi:hypothetical protein